MSLERHFVTRMDHQTIYKMLSSVKFCTFTSREAHLAKVDLPRVFFSF